MHLPLTLLSSLALAADAATQTPSPWVQASGALYDLLALVATAAVGMLTAYLKSKADESKAARVALTMTELTRAVVMDMDVVLRAKLKAAAADGVITPEEAADLKAQAKAEAMKAAMTRLPPALMDAAQAVLGPALETFVSGKIEQAVAEKKAVEAAAAPRP